MPKQQPIQYEAEVPAFLQRLKAGHAELDGRHNVQIPRARGGANARLKMSNEEEDEPVIVDEAGNVVEKAEFETSKRVLEPEQSDDVTQENGVSELERRTERSVDSGFGRKRKAVKVVAQDDTGSEPASEVKSVKDGADKLSEAITASKSKAESKEHQEPKKVKRKKVKLSFDVPE